MTESDAVDVVEIAIKRHASDLTTKAMALVALLKLSSRFPSCSEYDRLFKLFVVIYYVIPWNGFGSSFPAFLL